MCARSRTNEAGEKAKRNFQDDHPDRERRAEKSETRGGEEERGEEGKSQVRREKREGREGGWSKILIDDKEQNTPRPFLFFF